MRFRDRRDAGRRLTERLTPLAGDHPLVIALPRGGVPVAAEIAVALAAPLDVLIVRKLGHPQQPELGLGAIAEGGCTVLNQRLITSAGVTTAALDEVAEAEQRELRRRVRRYRGDRPRVPVAGRTIVLVDDGLATGFTARAAIEVLRQEGAHSVVVAVPVAPAETVTELRRLADAVVCLETPEGFRAIGEWYDDFEPVPDDEVARLLAATGAPTAPATIDLRHGESRVEVPAGSVRLPGTLAIPNHATAVVLFAHGSGSNRHSPRNRAMADRLHQAGIATLLFDLVAADEDTVEVGLPLLAARLVEVTGWCRDAGLPPHVGYVGSSSGAAVALLAAAELGTEIGAVVSRGGRPDLAEGRLCAVRAATLLIVGSHDHDGLAANRRAAARLGRCEHRVAVVPGASHLFEEPGALDAAADLALEWLAVYLRPAATFGSCPAAAHTRSAT